MENQAVNLEHAGLRILPSCHRMASSKPEGRPAGCRATGPGLASNECKGAQDRCASWSAGSASVDWVKQAQSPDLRIGWDMKFPPNPIAHTEAAAPLTDGISGLASGDPGSFLATRVRLSIGCICFLAVRVRVAYFSLVWLSLPRYA